jgi:hypothetical protein
VLANAIALLTAFVSERGTVLRVRYEDLVREPRRELLRIGEFLGRDLSTIADRIDRGETFAAGHNTGGNRAGKAGALRLREDREWETRLGRTDRALYWAFGWPLALAMAARPKHRAMGATPTTRLLFDHPQPAFDESKLKDHQDLPMNRTYPGGANSSGGGLECPWPKTSSKRHR